MSRTIKRRRPESVLNVLKQFGLPDDFPLTPHVPTNRWYRKIDGKRQYFGALDDPFAALEQFNSNHRLLRTGRVVAVPISHDSVCVRDVVNAWLTAKLRLLESNELQQATFDDYKDAAGDIVSKLRPTTPVESLSKIDFARLRSAWAKRFGPSELGKHVGYVRSVFKYAYEADLIDRPMKFGPEFKRPSRASQRRVRQSKPKRMFKPSELRLLLDEATIPMRAAILLGVNCGWGSKDIALLPRTTLDLDSGIIDYPRVKNAIPRRAIIWPETIEALRDVLDTRPKHKDAADESLVFITKYGTRWYRYRPAGSKRLRGKDTGKVTTGSLTDGFRQNLDKMLREHSMKKHGVSFYALRHVFQTIGEEIRDMPAVERIMGHTADSSDMSDRYREHISDDRLRAVTDHVRSWLFGAGGAA